MSWGSLFQTEAAATTKVQSPIEERRVAGMAGKDDAANLRCFWADTNGVTINSGTQQKYAHSKLSQMLGGHPQVMTLRWSTETLSVYPAFQPNMTKFSWTTSSHLGGRHPKLLHRPTDLRQ